MLRTILAASAALTLASCATPYGEMGIMGGVSAQQISSDTWRMVARGNGFTEMHRVQDFVLLRAAETALENGYSHFVLLSADDRSYLNTATTPTTTYGNVTTGPGGASYSSTTYGGQGITLVHPGQDVLVRMLNEPVPGSFDAAEIDEIVGARIRDAE